MTEDEAKTKWCPFVRFHIEGKAPTFTVAANREQRGTRCIGSACMAWRWAGYRAADGAWVRKAEAGLKWDPANAEGSCGLAGAPQ